MRTAFFVGLTFACIATITCSNTSTNTNALSANTSPTPGTLVPLSPSTMSAVGDFPANITIDPAGKYAYVPNYLDNTISQYIIVNGLLNPMSPSTVASKNQNPNAVAVNGGYLYVTSDTAVSVYSINSGTGALAYCNYSGVGA